MQRIPSIWVCFTTQGFIQNWSVFRYQTHTSGHFYIGVAPWGSNPNSIQTYVNILRGDVKIPFL